MGNNENNALLLNQSYVGRDRLKLKDRDDEDGSWSTATSGNVLNQTRGAIGYSDRSVMSNSWYNVGQSDTMSDFSLADTLMTDGAIHTSKFRDKTEKLFDQFCKLLQLRSSDLDVVNIVSQMARTCRLILEETENDLNGYAYLRGKHDVAKKVFKASEWLESEMKTWDLIHVLYYDRKHQQNTMEDEDEFMDLRQRSEKAIISKLYESNTSLREYQVVVDWLEASYKNRARASMVSRLTGKSVGWENTLLQLKGGKDVAFGGSVQLVKSIDLDAPLRENRSLHPLDAEDEMLLSKVVFYDIRSGRLDDASILLCANGQPLKALVFEGWRLFDDPNYLEENSNKIEKLPIEGNPKRDIWKKSAWRIADTNEGDEYHRAALGALCGHLDSMKAVLKNWDDLLWAHLKVQIDIRVETEIRSCLAKNYVPMPERYWLQKISMDRIFEELAVHSDSGIRDYANSYVGVVQKYIILDDPGELLNQISIWIDDATNSPNVELSAHHLRFFTHIILFLKQINAIENDDQAEKVISAYVDALIMKGEAHLVAFYSSCLRPQTHINLYSKFLEPIKGKTARSDALGEAINMGLNVEKILKATVERARHREPNCYAAEKMQAGCISEFDENRIKSLEWLTFLPSLRVELFWQSNAMIRYYLAEQKTDCVKAVLKEIPIDGVNAIMDKYGNKESLPAAERLAIKEHLSYKLYIDALNLFDEWYDLYQKCPKSPETPTEQKHFSERVAVQQEQAVYQQDYEKWSKAFDEQTTVARDALFKILSFPEGGWLVDPEPIYSPFGVTDLDLENRSNQLQNIRSICIPEVILLLHKMLTIRKDRHGCMQIANIVAREMNQLHSIFPREKMVELLYKLAETSIEFLNSNLDPWGFPTTS